MPLTRRQIYRRRRIAVFGGAVVLLAAGFYLPVTLLAPLPTVAAAPVSYELPEATAPALDFPAYGASGIGAIGYDGVLASAGPATPLPIASITKVVTALVVLDAHPLEPGEQGPDITFSATDEQFYDQQVANDGIVVAVQSGQVMSQRNVMSLMLMVSANNYGQSLANWAFGSEAAYVVAANSWLQAQGFTGTTITDATGIQPTNTSTVADLIALGKLALASPVIAEIVATGTLDVPGIGPVTNRNGLLGIDGVDGIKTGTLDEAGACLLFSADHTVGSETITLVGVVLGGPDHATIDAAIRGLLTQVDAGFREVTLAAEGETFGSFQTPWGDDASAVVAADTNVVAWSGAPVTVDVTVDDVRLAKAGTDVGDLVFHVGDRDIPVDLELSATIDDPGPWWRLTNPAALF